MSPSGLALRLAATAPGLASLGLRVWAASYLRRPRRPHWLFVKLKSDLRLRLKKRARLCSGQRVCVDPFDIVGGAIARDGCYEPETVAVFQRLLSPGAVTVDAGAHVGQYTLLASLAVAEQGQVHAFEPDPTTFELLDQNVRRNHCANVTANRAALGRDTCLATLYYADVFNTGGNSLRPDTATAGPHVTVAVRSLDAYAAARRLARLDVLKADVEGAELLLLEGAHVTIARFTPTMILEFSVKTALFGYSRTDLRQALARAGYSLFRIGRMPLRPDPDRGVDPDFFNVLAVHHRKHADLVSRGVLKA
jgi:FkbM family methyltransferase